MDPASKSSKDQWWMQPQRHPLFEIAFAFLCLYLLIHFSGPLVISSSQQNGFTVDGSGEVQATPSKANFTVGVTKTSQSEQDAKDQMNQITNKVIADMKAAGIQEKDIKTINFSVQPEVETPIDAQMPTAVGIVQPNSRPVSKGFTASQNLEVTANSTDSANKALEAAVVDGANQISGVNFTFDDSKQEVLYNQARTKAIANAKQKAEELAREAGIRLGRITNITDNNSGVIRPLEAGAAMKSSSDTQTNLQPGQNTISAQVTLTYEMR